MTDITNDTIRRISPAGEVTTIGGSPGQSGDSDGLGVRARFYFPDGVLIDSAGVLYISDDARITKGTPISNVPALSIMQSAGTLQVSWPASASDYIIESSSSLSPANWQSVEMAPLPNENQYSISDSAGDEGRFFRLRKP